MELYCNLRLNFGRRCTGSLGDVEARTPVYAESMVGYQPCFIEILTLGIENRETVSGGQFDWGGRLLKSNGGVQRFPQNGWKSFAECKGTRELDCETYKSSRCESRT